MVGNLTLNDNRKERMTKVESPKPQTYRLNAKAANKGDEATVAKHPPRRDETTVAEYPFEPTNRSAAKHPIRKWGPSHTQ